MSVRSLAAMLALGLLVGASIVQSAASARPPCLVSNERTHRVSHSLQQAIDAAAAGDTLLVRGTCVGASQVTKDLTLQGVSTKQFGDATLDGGGSGADRVLFIGAVDRLTVAIDSLTITHGGSGGILADGLVGSTVSLTHTTVSDNNGSGVEGEFSTMTLTDSTVSGNAVTGVTGDRVSFGLLRTDVTDNDGFGIGCGNCFVSVADSTVSGNGLGGIGSGSNGTVSISGSTVSGNDGPGIQLFDASVSMTNSSVSGNTTSRSGGGIYSFEGSGDLTNSTVTGNTAGENGGGIYMAPGSFRLNNSTVSGNTAGGNGGGIYLTGGNSDLVLTGSTVSGNTATSGGGIFNDGGSVTLAGTNSFFDNVPDDCVGVVGC
jgi:parallel beta-helix repeat protein/predicted outer membrane repeat protein